MKIFLNDSELDLKHNLTLPQIFKNIKKELNGKIISKIYINEVEVNERYLKESLIEKEDINKLRFMLKDNNELIKETLEEIDGYLPRLKNGCIETSNLLRNGDFKPANEKYQYIIEGLNWYSQTISNIINLLNLEEYINLINNNLTYMNKTLEELIEAYENEDNILVADILEYEIADFIDTFIELNKQLKKEIIRIEKRS